MKLNQFGSSPADSAGAEGNQRLRRNVVDVRVPDNQDVLTLVQRKKQGEPSVRHTLNKSASRRTLLGLAPVVAATIWAGRGSASNARQLELEGDCTSEPAVELLYNFFTLNVEALQYLGLTDLDGWKLAESTQLGPFMVPGDWDVVNVWANDWEDNGIPRWQAEPMPAPAWSATMVISPGQDAFWVYVYGSVDGPHQTTFEIGDLARSVIVGSDARLREICATGQQEAVNTDLENTLFLTADRQGSEMLLTHGWALQSPFTGPSLGSGATFGITGMVAPRRDAEEIMQNVYLRIMFQLLPKGSGGAGPPTPTSTPINS